MLSPIYHLRLNNHYSIFSAQATTSLTTMTKPSECVSEASSDESSALRSTPISSAALLSTSPATIKPSPHSSFRMIDLLTKSTIYRRHEARLARSLALRDDPRPAPIRVMSGLPGLRIVFRPYRPDESPKNFDRLYTNKNQHRGKQRFPTTVVPAAYSEETLFKRYSDADDNSVVKESSGNTTANDYTMKPFAPERILQAMVATGFSSGVAEYAFAYWKNNRTSQFTMASISSPFSNSNFSNNARPSTGIFPRALSVALPTSLLFGAKVLLDSFIENQQRDKNAPFGANDIVSSAFAGALVGSTQFALLQTKSPAEQLPTSSFSTMHQQHYNTSGLLNLMRRNVVAAVLYFSIYDGVSSLSAARVSSPNHDAKVHSSSTGSGKKETLDILLGGALAGVAHTATMHSHRYFQYGSMIWWSRVMLPAITRAAPMHAFVFYGYEQMKDYANPLP